MNNYLTFLIVSSILSCSSENTPEVLPFFNSSDFTPEWIDQSEARYDSIHVIAPFSFLNQDNEVITNKSLIGKPFVVNFFFTTCPGLCPRLSSSMQMLQDSLMNSSAKLVSYTVMPSHDSVAVLNKYAESNGVVTGKWHLLTGEKDEIYELARTSYFADEDFVKTKKASDFIHTENFLLVDSQGRIRGVYNGTIQLEMLRLLKHIKILEKETD